MTYSQNRRSLLLAAAMLPVARAVTARAAEGPQPTSTEAQLATLEKSSGGRLGLFALNTATGEQTRYRADERFPFCSTFKVILAGAILTRSTRVPGFMQQCVNYAQSELVHYSPVTAEHVGDGMTVAELCRAAIQYSDNTSANLLMKMLGGPAAVTSFARSIGNSEFRLDRWETELNSVVPGDQRDTSTPAAMARSLQTLALGDTLPPPQRAQLLDWLRGNKMGAKRIGAAVPADWQIGDKTGTGDYGTANDIAVLWPPAREPVVLAIYHTQLAADAKSRDDVIAVAARIVVNALG
ncbi:class A beta-lactamase [Paraburkholderia sp. BL10I2N1]|uniref:class A beta-lactamase n=1 Tax=Paraburkholderia sp. BL10I2N1 TaxID=1938796 RepID=UPI00105CFA5D|nr:class A beta-lactamase [Paraburkholderia sp. BL10I2N1]TDN69746.1 beta-lactamase class A [Paraburkholderia sp. BL10I2N1]